MCERSVALALDPDRFYHTNAQLSRLTSTSNASI